MGRFWKENWDLPSRPPKNSTCKIRRETHLVGDDADNTTSENLMPKTVQLPVCGTRTTPLCKLQHSEDHACLPHHWCLHGTDTQHVLNHKHLSNRLKKEGTHKQMSKQHSTIQLKTLCLCKSGVYYPHLLSPVEPCSSLSFTSSPVSPHQLNMSWDPFPPIQH